MESVPSGGEKGQKRSSKRSKKQGRGGLVGEIKVKK